MASDDECDVSIVRIGTDAYGILSYEPDPEPVKSQPRVIDSIEIEDDVEEIVVLDDDSDSLNRSPTSKKLHPRRKKIKTTPLLKPLFAVQTPLVAESPQLPNTLTELPCKYCTKIFYGKNEFQLHELDHFKSKILKRIKKNRQMLPCPTCGNKLGTRSELEWHSAECKGKARAKRASQKLTRSNIRKKKR